MSLVAIVGRPNVGKSTLFNRLVGMRKAIVDDTAGVTRDRHYGKCEWCGSEFSVVDTGGYTSNSEDVFEKAIRRQVEIAIEEADAVIFMVEAATGITDYDAEIADVLRRSKKPVILCVNKVDTGEKVFDTYQFYGLGLGELWSISLMRWNIYSLVYSPVSLSCVALYSSRLSLRCSSVLSRILRNEPAVLPWSSVT